MNRYDVKTWTCFVLFVAAVSLGGRLAGAWGVIVTCALALGLLVVIARHGHLSKIVKMKPEQSGSDKGSINAHSMGQDNNSD